LEEDNINVSHLSTDKCSYYNTIGNPQELSPFLSRGRLDNELVGGRGSQSTLPLAPETAVGQSFMDPCLL
jgi:hypothetical protein